jgi:glutamate-1-semialdehyde 2,1-aminomutase
MDYVAPLGSVYQAGTLSGNPLAMAAGIAMLSTLSNNPQIYANIGNTTSRLVKGFQENIHSLNLDFTINHIGSMFTLFFTNQHVIDFETAKSSNTQLFAKYFRAMLNRGVYLAPSQYESLFVSNAIEDEHIEYVIDANKKALKEII